MRWAATGPSTGSFELDEIVRGPAWPPGRNDVVHEARRLGAVFQADDVAELMHQYGGEAIAAVDPERPSAGRVDFDEGIDEDATSTHPPPPAFAKGDSARRGVAGDDGGRRGDSHAVMWPGDLEFRRARRDLLEHEARAPMDLLDREKELPDRFGGWRRLERVGDGLTAGGRRASGSQDRGNSRDQEQRGQASSDRDERSAGL